MGLREPIVHESPREKTATILNTSESSRAEVRTPECLGAGDCVERDEQLAHAGHQHDLLGFAGGQESLVAGFDGRIEARGHERSDVQHAAQAGTSVEDMALAPESAG